nr:trypsin-like peptidase domain-containing protein [Alphaproteobacteria bacterium]
MKKAWTKANLAAFLLAVFVSESAWAALDSPNGRDDEAGCRRNIPIDPMDDTLAAAVFKVYRIIDGGGREAVGTATLIDNRGYFLSASHTTHYHYSQPETAAQKTWVEPYQGPLLLRSSYGGGIELTGQEIVHGDPTAGYDFSLIKAELPAGMGTLALPVVDPVIIVPSITQDMTLLGYPSQSEQIFVAKLSGQYQSSRDDNGLLVVVGDGYGGESGAVALGQHGKAVGVLHDKIPILVGSDQRTALRFSPTYMARDLLNHVPPSPRAADLIALLKMPNGPMPLLDRSFRLLDGLAIRHALETNIDEYRESVRRYSFTLFQEMTKRGLCADAAWFLVEFGTNAPLYRRVDAGRALLRNALAMRTDESRQEVANMAVAILDPAVAEGLKVAREDPATNRYWSRVSYDYALAMHVSGIAAEQGGIPVIAAATRAIELDPAYANAFELVGSVFQNGGRPDLAAAAIASAFNNSPESKKPKLAKDWRYLAGQKISGVVPDSFGDFRIEEHDGNDIQGASNLT